MLYFCASALFVFFALHQTHGWGSDKVRLSDVRVLTLTNGHKTNGRRSAPVHQLQCVGGSAGCHAFVPGVVQCTNVGSDGYDAQWECKADMDNAYKFGKVEVTCEGYDYADDPYVLQGSCGLEYTIDYTGKGQGHGSHSGYSGYSHDYSSTYKKSGLGDLILLGIVGLVVYAVYRTCVANSAHTGSDMPRPEPSAPPPPPGFRPEYTDNQGYGSGMGYGGCNTNSYPRHRTNNDGMGFWSGAGLGGLAGYFLGNRNQGYYGSNTHTGYGNPGYRPRSSWFGGGGSGWGGSSGGFSGGSSGGSRTASGFGGTKRR